MQSTFLLLRLAAAAAAAGLSMHVVLADSTIGMRKPAEAQSLAPTSVTLVREQLHGLTEERPGEEQAVYALLLAGVAAMGFIAVRRQGASGSSR